MIFNVEEETEDLAWWDQAGCHMPCVKTREEFANRSKTLFESCPRLEALNLDFFSCPDIMPAGTVPSHNLANHGEAVGVDSRMQMIQ